MDKILSVLTVTHNNENSIDDYLKTIIHSLPPNSEIIIIDSGSSDKTLDKINSFKSEYRNIDIKLYPNKENIGYGGGSNVAANYAKGKYLLLLNPDTRTKDDAISKLIQFAKQNEKVGLIAPKLVQSNGEVQPSVRKLPTILGAIAEYYFGIKNMYEAYVPKTEQAVEVECVVGAAILIRREIFINLKGFNEKFFLYYEDIDLCKRIRKMGLKIFYLPEVLIEHQVGGSISEQKTKWIKTSAKIYHGNLAGLLLDFILRLRPLK